MSGSSWKTRSQISEVRSQDQGIRIKDQGKGRKSDDRGQRSGIRDQRTEGGSSEDKKVRRWEGGKGRDGGLKLKAQS